MLDGELVLPDTARDGLEFTVRAVPEWELVYFAFDMLHGDGQDLRRIPLVERKRRLAHLIGRARIPCLHLVQVFDDGVKLLEAAERHELKGIISKRREFTLSFGGVSRLAWGHDGHIARGEPGSAVG